MDVHSIIKLLKSYHCIAMLFVKDVQAVLQAKSKLSFAEFLVLMTIDKEGCHSAHQVAKHLNHSDAAISRQVNALIEKMFIERKPGADRRVADMSLTQIGQDALEQAKEDIEAHFVAKFKEVKSSFVTDAQKINQEVISILSKKV